MNQNQEPTLNGRSVQEAETTFPSPSEGNIFSGTRQQYENINAADLSQETFNLIKEGTNDFEARLAASKNVADDDAIGMRITLMLGSGGAMKIEAEGIKSDIAQKLHEAIASALAGRNLSGPQTIRSLKTELFVYDSSAPSQNGARMLKNNVPGGYTNIVG